MHVVFVDGPSKVGKSCLGDALEANLSEEMAVSFEVAGDFFRTTTAAVLGELDLHEGTPRPKPEVLEAAVNFVLVKEIMYEPDRDWGDLHAKVIDDYVGEISKKPLVQAAGEGWYNTVSERAHQAEVDVLILDGRNPRDRIRPWLAERPTASVALDLYVTCGLIQAAERSLAARGITRPTATQRAKEETDLSRRRHIDATRKVFPQVEPTNAVLLNGISLSQTVELTWAADDAPRPILFDTTKMPKDVMIQQAVALTRAALDLS